MLDRNRRIKPKPERFQACKEKFDIVITCEERVYDQVVEGMLLFHDYRLGTVETGSFHARGGFSHFVFFQFCMMIIFMQL